MAKKTLPEQSAIKQQLEYDTETGWLTRKARDVSDFHSSGGRPAASVCARWNARYTISRAGGENPESGYRHIRLFDGRYAEHRLIWMMVHGEEPDHIDHINGDRADNRLSNLRSVTKTDNARNRALPTTNKSGVIGVSWYPSNGCWRAVARVNGQPKILLRTMDREKAIAVRLAWERENGYHVNHGRPIA